FVDDAGAAADTFKEGLEKLRRMLERVRKEGLSLALGKTKLFMMETTFAGALVGPKGVSPDITKLTAIV
ncbi:hypothetical protein FA15DRAFT_548780, partial [Coprinopsis marcescibilis]